MLLMPHCLFLLACSEYRVVDKQSSAVGDSEPGSEQTQLWHYNDIGIEVPITVGDLDSDGSVEVITLDKTNHVMVLNPDGTLKWVSGGSSAGSSSHNNMVLFDLDQDKVSDIVMSGGIFSGKDGQPLMKLGENGRIALLSNVVVQDIDLDGIVEILSLGTVFNSEGHVEVFYEPESVTGSIPLLIQIDNDLEAEVAWFIDGKLIIFETDGQIVFEYAFESIYSTFSNSCSYDVNGDGKMEIIYENYEKGIDNPELTVIDHEGKTIEIYPLYDPTTAIGCSLFDFNVDGFPEVMFVDHDGFEILDGQTLEAVYLDETMTSMTAGEVPKVVDVDGDGSVEIVMTVVPSESSHPAIRIYGNRNRDWPPGGRVWPTSNWSGSGMWSDGRIQSEPVAPWLDYGIWRGQPPYVPDGQNLSVEIVDQCVSSCEDMGEVELAIRIHNHGPQPLTTAVPVTIYQEQEEGQFLPISSLLFEEPLNSGEASTTQVFSFSQTLVSLKVVVGDDGRGVIDISDCDHTDNTIFWKNPC